MPKAHSDPTLFESLRLVDVAKGGGRGVSRPFRSEGEEGRMPRGDGEGNALVRDPRAKGWTEDALCARGQP